MPDKVAFLLLKPDGIAREKEIMAILDRDVTVVASRRFSRAPMRRIAALYAEHLGQPFFPWLMDYFRGLPVKALLVKAKRPRHIKSIHELIADIVGATDPKLAKPGTVRSLSDDDMTVSISQKRIVRNLIHRSRTDSESRREAALFFSDLNLFKGGRQP